MNDQLPKALKPLVFKPLSTKTPNVKTSREKVVYTEDGFIDTGYFWERPPQWVLEHNKQKEITISKEYAKYPPGLWDRIIGNIFRFSGYETYSDIRREPEKYKNVFKMVERYLQEVKDPQVDWRLKGGRAFLQRYTTGISPQYRKLTKEHEEIAKKKFEEKLARGETPIAVGIWEYKTLWADMTEKDKVVACEALNQQYQRQGLDKEIKPKDLKEENTIELRKMIGLLLDLSPADLSNVVFMGVAKLGVKALGPAGAMLKQKGMNTTVGKSVIKIYRKTYASKTILQLGDEGVTSMKRILARSDDLAEAETKLLNIYRPGWQKMLGKQLFGKELPEGVIRVPSLIDQAIEKITKRPTGQKAIEYFHKKFARGYGDTLVKDFGSRIKALGIKKNSWEDITVRNMLNAEHPEDYIKYLTGLTDEMTQAYTWTKKVNRQILQIEQMMGTAYDINEIQNYLYRLYIERPGKPIAYNIGREIGVDKPVIAYNRTFKTIEEARKAGYIVADGFIEPMIQRLKIHGDIMGKQGYLQALKDTYGEKFIRDTRAATSAVYKELWDQGKRKVYGVKELREYMFDNDLAKILENQVRPLSGLESGFLKWNKNVMGPIKKIWTFTTGFHLRNLYGSHAQNMLEYGADSVFNANKQVQAARLAWKSDEFGVMIGGQTYKASAIRELFDMSGIGAGWYRGDIMQGGQRSVLGKALGGAWDKTMGFAGDMTERQVRMFSMVEALDQTGNYIDSILKTKLLHFDYLDGLSRAERIYGRAIWPFYTWKRFNAPLQVYFLGTKTNRVANIFRVQRTMGIGDPAEIPLWFNRYIMGKIGTKDLNTNVQKYLKLDIPLAQIALFTPSYDAIMHDKELPLGEQFTKFLSPFVAESNPVLKTIFEIITRFDTFRTKETWQFPVRSPLPDFILNSFPDFFKNKIELEKDEDGYYVMNPEWAKLLENLPALYQMKVLSGYEAYPEYKKQKWFYDKLSLIGGIKIYPVDEDYYEKITEKEMDRMKKRREEFEEKMEKIKEFRIEEKEGPLTKGYKPVPQIKYKPLGGE